MRRLQPISASHRGTPWQPTARPWRCLALSVVAWLATATSMGTAWAREDLGFGGSGEASKKAPFVSPDGSFAAQVPSFWQARAYAAAHVIEFRLPGPGDSWLQVRRVDVAPGTAPKQLLLRAREDRLAKLPHFEELSRRDMSLSGNPAAILVGQFWYQGNAEYPRAVEELFLVTGNEAFEMHFECFAPLIGSLRGDLLTFYTSFVAHPAAAPPPAKPQAPAAGENYFDRLPF